MAKTWEETKRAAQSAFSNVANAYYQDILNHGHLIPYEIDGFPFYLDRDEYHQYLDEANKDIPDPEPESGI